MKKDFSLSSMTAFGQGEVISKQGRILVEIQSLNRRYLEFNLNLPKSLSYLEMQIRQFLSKKLFRGQITLSLLWQKDQKIGIKPNLSLAHELKEGWDQIAQHLKLQESFNLSLIASEPNLFLIEEENFAEEPFFEALETALSHLLKMKEEEGEKLAKDLDQRLSFLETQIAQIEKKAPLFVEKYREKLKKRTEEIADLPDNEERILREIVLFAEKSDVTEEIVRFKIHVEQFRKTMKEGFANGKKLDFLLQELVRESNTIGSKGQETAIVVEIKSELEKMREQVQNIE